jgi:hypothetical protein
MPKPRSNSITLRGAAANDLVNAMMAPTKPRPTNPPEGCILAACWSGDGWNLEVVRPGTLECVALLAWPESWPKTMTAEQLGKFGFEIC